MKLYIVGRSAALTGQAIEDRKFFDGMNIMTEDGKFLLPEWVSTIKKTASGFFLVMFDLKGHFETASPWRYRILDGDGKDITDIELLSVELISEGAVLNETTDQFGYPKYTLDHYDKHEAIFYVQRAADGKRNYLRGDGTLMFPHWYDAYERWGSAGKFGNRNKGVGNDFIRVKDGGLVNFINFTSGEPVSPIFFEKTSDDWTVRDKARRQVGDEFLELVKYNGRWTILTKTGELKKLER